jgi:hypothetical protein
VQARIDDIVRMDPTTGKWLDEPGHSFEAAKIDPAQAGAIADEELAALRGWLEKKWNATPRDTALLTKMIKYLPGGEKLTQWSRPRRISWPQSWRRITRFSGMWTC